MQKFVILFIAFILSVFPIVNASALQYVCGDMMPVTKAMTTAMPELKSDLVSEPHSMSNHAAMSMDMSSTHDCCETPNQTCDHASACDCENSQVNYSTVPKLDTENLHYLSAFQAVYVFPSFHSKSPDSLYRPPINIFI